MTSCCISGVRATDAARFADVGKRWRRLKSSERRTKVSNGVGGVAGGAGVERVIVGLATDGVGCDGVGVEADRASIQRAHYRSH